VLFAVSLTALMAALLFQGFVRHEVGTSSTSDAGDPVTGLGSVGPVVDLSGRQIASAQPPPREIALTFDDGPSSRWTPQLLALLRHDHVPATFFVVGAQALAHPGIVRQELRDGDEVASHTFTHANLSTLPAWRANLELSLTQTALAGVAGVNTSLLRLPYSSVPSAMTTGSYHAAKAAAAFGYLVVFATNDTEDWRRPGVTEIITSALPPRGQGAVVLMHDAGGDRSQTVAAVAQLVPILRAQGYRFVTLTDLVGLPPRTADVRVVSALHWQGIGLLWGYRTALAVTLIVTVLLIPVGALFLLRIFLVAVFARRQARRAKAPQDRSIHPPATVVVPAFNEAVGIEATVRSLVESHYADFEVIVVDDGSTDGTAEKVEDLGLPGVTVVRQPNGGKPSALNTGIARARGEVIVMVDGDTVFEPQTLGWVVQPFADPSVGAVSGNTKVGNRRGLLGAWQHIEYVLGFNLDRRMYDLLRCMPTVPGAIGAFRREALEAVGGVSDDTLAEDTDLTMAINRAGWRVAYEERARAWTEAPASLGPLWRQRYRWCYGTMQAMWKHRRALLDRHSALGQFGLPYLLCFQVLLPLFAPAIDLVAIYGLLFLNPWLVAGYWLGFNALQVAVGWYAFRLDGESPRVLWLVPIQQFVYRQLMYLVVIQSFVSALVGTRLRWQKLRRVGGVEVRTA
jgi:cellulose synthase/poly-beta-1,6-N-acetylglucosamine synthase-like glycosyltransferase/peptidoglycan/xylan/chitin deacetylase (PgdA/CDA1 family)